MANVVVPLLGLAIHGALGFFRAHFSSNAIRARLEAEKEYAEKRIKAIEDELARERNKAEKRRQDMENLLKAKFDASEERRKEMEEEFRAEMRASEERRKKLEEQLERDREEAARKQKELDEELRKERERAEAAEAARAAFEASWRAGEPPSVAELSKEQIAQAKSSYLDGRVHIAFVGQSGSGKSTLTNSIRGLKANSTGAARVNQNEGTRKTARYPDQMHPHHVWYDVPGAGTLECPDWQYFMDKELYVYDALVVVFSDRLMLNDIRVLSNAEQLNIPTFLVRSKSDQILRNMQSDYEESLEECKARFVRSTREYIREVLEQVEGVDEMKKVYMISRDGVLRVTRGGGGGRGGLDEQELVNDLLRVEPARTD